jgi:NAD(P)-dependent dehydrogenase (short-subunit alcohol dehydrogenase family)
VATPPPPSDARSARDATVDVGSPEASIPVSDSKIDARAHGGSSVVTKYRAKELAGRQIRVNSVSPGPVVTNLADGAMAKHPEYLVPLSAQTALGRVGQPDDIASAIAALLSDDNRWVTAVDLDVSGGLML